MTDQELKDLVASLAVKSDRLDAQQAKTDAQMAKTDEKLKRLSELYGNVADNQGSAVEEFFFNSLRANPMIGGIRYGRVVSDMLVGNQGKQAEFDLVLVNGNSVAVIEVKHKAHLSALDRKRPVLPPCWTCRRGRCCPSNFRWVPMDIKEKPRRRHSK